ncbi:MAG: phosphodiester glycosidase family protein [Oscillospiraceae bacterium]|nr:phosphodiester glycosidase family protein [Oscillospiraceae bacterium]
MSTDRDVTKQDNKQKNILIRILLAVLKVLAVAVETVLLVAAVLYAVMFLLTKGPSKSARDLFVMSVRETSAIGFLADWFLTEDEIAQIEASKNEEVYYAPTDTSLITINTVPEPDLLTGPQADAWGLVDDDGDGVIIEEIHGKGYSGFMMVVLDPSRVIMGCVPESLGRRGYTVAEMAEHYDAVAAINAGGFEDPDGRGNGSRPDSLIVFKGTPYFAFNGMGSGFVGIDDQYILHAGLKTLDEVMDANIQYGVCFGPVLVSNGEITPEGSLSSGLNPRTAIGQRSDGAILMLVIDGRQVISLGATFRDIAEIMVRYGAVNACNLDGGSSTLMWYNGKYINNCASVIGIRPVPSTFIVLKEGVTP